MLATNYTINEGTRDVTESIAILSKILTALFFVIINLVLLTYAGWIVYLIRRMVKPRHRRGEEESETENVSISNLSIRGKKGKFLLALLIFELLSIMFYELAAILGYLFWKVPELRVLGINMNTSCSADIAIEIYWLSELQYPEVSISTCLARASLLFSLALGTSFMQFVTNSYVTKSWQYKRTMMGVWVVLPLCILIIIFGSIPQTMPLGWTVNIIVLLTYYCLATRTTAFLNRVLGWREQDLKCYDEYEQLKRHRKVVWRFRTAIRIILSGLALLILQDMIVQIEIVVCLFLFYGQCVFPAIYGIPYTAPIQPDDSANFKLGLYLVNLIQGIVLVTTTGCLLLPQTIVTLLLPLYSCYRAVNGGEKRNIRFQIIREPLIPSHYN